jgi:hypothetical protein
LSFWHSKLLSLRTKQKERANWTSAVALGNPIFIYLLRNGSSGEGFVNRIKCSFKYGAQLLFEAYFDILNINETQGQMVLDSKYLQSSGRTTSFHLLALS